MVDFFTRGKIRNHGVKYVYLLPSNSLLDSNCLDYRYKALNRLISQNNMQKRTGNIMPGELMNATRGMPTSEKKSALYISNLSKC